ncbi:MAG: hypothetical protein HYU41_19885 [Candidatus Rokubacteria bacterium]|nr:hypothetical protein [Candidatus Rokubacteria bacterium]
MQIAELRDRSAPSRGPFAVMTRSRTRAAAPTWNRSARAGVENSTVTDMLLPFALPWIGSPSIPVLRQM